MVANDVEMGLQRMTNSDDHVVVPREEPPWTLIARRAEAPRAINKLRAPHDRCMEAAYEPRVVREGCAMLCPSSASVLHRLLHSTKHEVCSTRCAANMQVGKGTKDHKVQPPGREEQERTRARGEGGAPFAPGHRPRAPLRLSSRTPRSRPLGSRQAAHCSRASTGSRCWAGVPGRNLGLHLVIDRTEDGHSEVTVKADKNGRNPEANAIN